MSDTEQRIAELERRLQEIEDREAIREVIARYGFTADLGYDDEYVAQYTEDGEYDIGGGRVHRGHEELYEFIHNPLGGHKRYVEGRGSQHTSHNLIIRVDGDTAWAECYSVVFVRTGPHTFDIHTAAYNHWDFRRIDGRWRIRRRRRVPIGDAVQLPDGVSGRDVMTEFVGAVR